MHVGHATIEDLSALLDDELTEDERAEVETHLSGCDACRLDLEQLRQTTLALHALPVPRVPRSFAIATPPAPVTRAPVWLWQPGWLRACSGVAAALMVVLLLVDVGHTSSATFGDATRQAAPAAVPALGGAAPGSNADQGASANVPAPAVPRAQVAVSPNAAPQAPSAPAAARAPLAAPAPAGVTPAPSPAAESGSAPEAAPAPPPVPIAGPHSLSPGQLAAAGCGIVALALFITSFWVAARR